VILYLSGLCVNQDFRPQYSGKILFFLSLVVHLHFTINSGAVH